ncbi:RNA 2',3'-cyclic phosphodiesterase [Cognatiluteimonas profundi]|uniref:RNA 2',3'-cyclic phosphodiesterase n=1 Tax=Cognatiluteimonas profundi TaxID=2594501 RepID=UPI00131A78CF|nr:RNA 2',3'-cyclic phosphodiesterase [Lysobacter profundi]
MSHPADAREPGNLAIAAPHRLFFALWPDDAVRSSIAQAASLLDDATGGRVTAPESYHLTVLFLGDFRPLPQSVLSTAMVAGASMRVEPFELSLDRVGAFPGNHVLWLGPGVVPAGLLALHERLMQALAPKLSMQREAGFVPHVTVRRKARAAVPPLTPPVVRWPVRDFVLVDSRPGMPYRILARWPLLTR